MDLSYLTVLLPMLFRGLKITILIAVVGILCGFIIGAVCGFIMTAQKCKIGKAIVNVYIWVIRGTPIMVQALYVYFVVPRLTGVTMQSNTAGIFVIMLNSGAFITEIVRGALQGIDPGQREAGVSLGLSNWQTTWHIIVPPALKSMLPALCNQFIISLKDTALLSVIVVNEITKQIQNYAAMSFKTIEAYTTGAVFYLVLISILMVIEKIIEKKMATD